MNEEMKFPKTFEEFIKQYSFFDKQQIYTNGSELIQVFRIKQWKEHKEKENQELKKQLENCYCNRTDCSGRIKDSKVYDSLVQKVETQQKEFIKYLEDEIKELQKIKETELDYDILKDVISQLLVLKEILQKYKEIIGE
nr:MAG TPA: FIBRINOGEN ALPHA CHAIN, FIBRINOGEN BETA ADHESION, VIRULENCE FACTOR, STREPTOCOCCAL.5A [Caudoviricetes sp.]